MAPVLTHEMARELLDLRAQIPIAAASEAALRQHLSRCAACRGEQTFELPPALQSILAVWKPLLLIAIVAAALGVGAFFWSRPPPPLAVAASALHESLAEPAKSSSGTSLRDYRMRFLRSLGFRPRLALGDSIVLWGTEAVLDGKPAAALRLEGAVVAGYPSTLFTVEAAGRPWPESIQVGQVRGGFFSFGEVNVLLWRSGGLGYALASKMPKEVFIDRAQAIADAEIPAWAP